MSTSARGHLRLTSLAEKLRDFTKGGEESQGNGDNTESQD